VLTNETNDRVSKPTFEDNFKDEGNNSWKGWYDNGTSREQKLAQKFDPKVHPRGIKLNKWEENIWAMEWEWS